MDMMKMMAQAKEMQDKMMQMQKDLENVEVEGESGGGMVTVTMTCKGVLKGIKIAPEVISPTDPEMLEDLIIAAVNDGKSKGDAKLADETKSMMGSMGLPSDIKLPF
jgi:DNA-binding YbaB/EbfC family protein